MSFYHFPTWHDSCKASTLLKESAGTIYLRWSGIQAVPAPFSRETIRFNFFQVKHVPIWNTPPLETRAFVDPPSIKEQLNSTVEILKMVLSIDLYSSLDRVSEIGLWFWAILSQFLLLTFGAFSKYLSPFHPSNGQPITFIWYCLSHIFTVDFREMRWHPRHPALSSLPSHILSVCAAAEMSCIDSSFSLILSWLLSPSLHLGPA